MVRDRITGLVVPPKPIAIAEAMDDLFKDKKNAEKMGEEVKRDSTIFISMNITWENVVRRLKE